MADFTVQKGGVDLAKVIEQIQWMCLEGLNSVEEADALLESIQLVCLDALKKVK